MTMGTSAPPTGSTKRMPKISESRSSTATPSVDGEAMTHTAQATVRTAMPMVMKRPAGRTTGRVVMISCSFRKVTTDPLADTPPMSTVRTVATRKKPPFVDPYSRNSTRATRAAAPPPAPLKSATSCGIAVILTLRAATRPMTVPATRATRITMRLSSSMPLKKRITVARSAPTAPRSVPMRADFGDDRPLSDRMKRTAATR